MTKLKDIALKRMTEDITTQVPDQTFLELIETVYPFTVEYRRSTNVSDTQSQDENTSEASDEKEDSVELKEYGMRQLLARHGALRIKSLRNSSGFAVVMSNHPDFLINAVMFL